MEITQEYLKSILHYDPDSGVFTWKERKLDSFKTEWAGKTWNARFAEKEAGGVNSEGYIKILIKNKITSAHRLAVLYMTGRFPLHDTDHINGIRSDNRWKNIREVTNAQNMQNQIKARTNNKSTGLLGAYKIDGKFKASIFVNNKAKNLGFFDTAKEAHEAYIAAKRDLHPFSTL
jgi:hypothetical protein